MLKLEVYSPFEIQLGLKVQCKISNQAQLLFHSYANYSMIQADHSLFPEE
jgi:hypothetical protein